MDSSSILLAEFITLAVFSAAFIAVSNREKTLSYCRLWAAANVLLAAGLSVIPASPYLPAATLYFLVNSCLIAGLALLRQAAGNFHGLKPAWLQLALPVLVVAVAALSTGLGLPRRLSYAVFNLTALLLCADTIRIFVTHRGDGLHSRWGLIFCFSLLCLAFSLRLLSIAADAAGTATALQGAWTSSVNMVLILIFISANGAFSLALVFEKMAEEQKAAASRDPLTGAFNRREFFIRLNDELSRQTVEPFAVLQIDIDHFKQINDRFGHGAGDLALQQVTRTISACLGENDCLSRFGGEEFAILLPAVTYSAAVERAEAIREAVDGMRLAVAAEPVKLTVSAGLYHGTGKNLAPTDILRLADEHLYSSKHAGRNRVSAVQAA